MKIKAWGFVLTIALAIGFFAVAGIYAGTTMPTETKLYAPYDHDKDVIAFTHAKHVNEHKIACGECHHDDKGNPRTDLKEGDEVKRCFDCHNKPGEIKGKKAKGLSKEELLAYHANAVHENCVGCHKDYNRKNKTKAAPYKCTDCHPK